MDKDRIKGAAEQAKGKVKEVAGNQSPVKEPQPYKDPVEPPPGDPQEDRPMHDPVPPDGDRPR